MRIHLLSDLHIGFADFAMPDVEADVRILAGDIGTKLNGLKYALAQSSLPTVYLAGNHEYYGAAIPRLTEKMHDAAEGTHVHFLENDEVVINDTRILGCTLWTDFMLLGDDSRGTAMFEAHQQMNDYRLIRRSPRYSKLRPSDTRSIHLTSVRWLEARLSKPFAGKTVIVTHHAPSAKSLDPRYPVELISTAFASPLETLVRESRADLWIHGHTHYCADYRIGDTRVVSNQRGYPDEPAPGFDSELVLTL